MCGLVATIGLRTPLDAALSRLAHRGPDGSGLWRSTDGVLALGHRRLAIVGGPTARQPVKDRGVAAILNGQLYGWRDQTSTAPGDAGIVPPLYRQVGADLGHHLRGEFAIILADTSQRRLVALRDPWGTKPLYVARIGDGLAVASELSALVALGVPPELDKQTLEHAYTHQYPPPTASLMRGVTRLPAGGRLVAEWEDDRLRVHRDRWTRPAFGGGSSPHPDELVTALDDAVRLRLDSDRPVGALLSGGLDSSAIVDSAWRQGATLPCFTVRFPGKAYDEGGQATAFATARGCPLHTVDATHLALLDGLPDAVASAGGLCINGQMVARRLLARRVRNEGVVVVLSGEGSDEIGLGYPHLLLDSGAEFGGVTSAHGPQSGVMLPSGRAPGLAPFDAWLGRTPGFLRAKASFAEQLVPLLHTVPSGVVGRLATSLESLTGPTVAPVHAASTLWMALCLDGYILSSISDAQDMAEGVENRPPFLDSHVWSVARRIPADSQTKGGLGKAFFRSALAGRLGDVSERPKHPFLAPPLLAELPQDKRLYDQAHGWLSGLDTVPMVSVNAAVAWLEQTVAAIREASLSQAEVARRDAALWMLMSTSALSAHFRSLG